MKWLKWEDLSEQEQKQATESYINIRQYEDEEQEIIPELVIECNFERMKDGYIYVDL